MRNSKIEGIILARRNYGEADKIITIFSLELGKIKILAKGVRRIKSRRASHLELFNEVELVIHQGKTFSQISEARTKNHFSNLKLNLKLTGYLFYLSEILDKILPEHQPHREVYSSFKATLSNLDTATGKNSEDKVKHFVIQLLWNLGYLPYGEYPKSGVTSFVESVVEKNIRSKKFLEEI